MAPKRQERAKKVECARTEAYESVCNLFKQNAQNNMTAPLPPASQSAVQSAFTAGEADPYGDGDQSPVPEIGVSGFTIAALQQPLRSAWATGLDLQMCLLTNPGFHHYCWLADVEGVQSAIENAKDQVRTGDTLAMTKLLETRFSTLRLSPLHMCCQGARTNGSKIPDAAEKYSKVATLLLDNGARVDSRDICGHTPLANCAGFLSSPQSLALVPLLVRYGANPNLKTRFGEPLLMYTITSGNVQAFRALVKAGADVNASDRLGLTPRSMAMNSPLLMKEVTAGQRRSMLKTMNCDNCGKDGANKYCAVCKRAYYCSKECQRKHWKSTHKSQCGKQDMEGEEFVDIVVGPMTTLEVAPGMTPPGMTFMNFVTSVASNRRMKMKKTDPFVVKLSSPIQAERMGMPGSVKINQKNSDWLLVKWDGEGEKVHEKLVKFVKEKGIESAKAYVSAKWVEQKEVDGELCDVLRIDTSRSLPPPKPLW